ncbi:putative endonuclease [Zunongwangia mangrovi]|uniref:Putative endonuclease n=2 Tax=Zunongwangia mangrovi TaxID=1334022 RepID=A0A1I1IA43_9FLAO|nr:putative endonuclease [Zunongwangia mangrovi]
MKEHDSGKYPDSYTYKRRPVELKFFNTFKDVEEAILFEKKIKKWSKAKKVALINSEFEKLPNLAKKKF